jgi:hypothetical protein
MMYWAGLYYEETQVVIRSSVETMLRMAFRILGRRARPNEALMITRRTVDAEQSESSEDANTEAMDDPSDVN